MDISVIICTHNPREDYLRRTLDALSAQLLPKEQWELLVVDNASSIELRNTLDLSWHVNSRYIREEKLGLTQARMRGIRESNGNLLVFVDDDNVLDPNYLGNSLRIAEERSFLGVFGAGVIEPEFEELPHEKLKPYLAMLALRSEHQPFWSNCPDDMCVPWGAGLVVTRSVADTHLQKVATSPLQMMLDRKGALLTSGGDDAFSWTACLMGLGRGVFPQLKVIHLIGRRRLEPDYLLKIAYGIAYSRTLLSHFYGHPIRPPDDQPTFRTVCQAFFQASISRFFYNGNRWWHNRSIPSFEREMQASQLNGVRDALSYLEKYHGRQTGVAIEATGAFK